MVQNPAAGTTGGFIKGMKDKAEEHAKMRECLTLQTPSEHLESIFLKEPFSEPSTVILSAPFPLNLRVLNADNIEIDDVSTRSPGTTILLCIPRE